jgi:hypothetical protein
MPCRPGENEIFQAYNEAFNNFAEAMFRATKGGKGQAPGMNRHISVANSSGRVDKIQLSKHIEELVQESNEITMVYNPPADVALAMESCIGLLVSPTLIRLAANLKESKAYSVKPTAPLEWGVYRKDRTPPARTKDTYRAFCPDHFRAARVTAIATGNNKFVVRCSEFKCNQTEEPCKHLLAVQGGAVEPNDFGLFKQTAVFAGTADSVFFASIDSLSQEQPGATQLVPTMRM